MFFCKGQQTDYTGECFADQFDGSCAESNLGTDFLWRENGKICVDRRSNHSFFGGSERFV